MTRSWTEPPDYDKELLLSRVLRGDPTLTNREIHIFVAEIFVGTLVVAFLILAATGSIT